MDRDEKKLDECLDSLITKCTDLKNSIGSFLVKLESEGSLSGDQCVNWTSALDSYAQISGQVNTVMRLLRSDQSMSHLKNLIMLPILMSPDKDEELANLTEGRVLSFNHEMVPNYLRTKQEPEIENTERSFSAKAGSMSQDQGTKAVNLVNKIVGQVTESVKSMREEWESGSSDAAVRSVTSSAAETNAIISAVTLGKALKGPPPIDPKLLQQQQQQQAQQQQQPVKGKAPAVRTNIKTNVHPYQKN